MSVKTVSVYIITCDGRGCTYTYDDLEFGGVVHYYTQEQAGAATVSHWEWAQVGNLHFCDEPACQAEAAAERQAIADRAPLPALPGQLELVVPGAARSMP